MNPHITPLDYDSELANDVRQALLQKTKPPGSLGTLETLALQLALIQRITSPSARRATVLVFAGDHGIVEEGVSPYPQSVTAQMVRNFLDGGAAISVLAREIGAELRVVDSGVVSRCSPHPWLIDRKIAPGTRNMRKTAAMSLAQAEQSLEIGRSLVASMAGATDVFVLGEMGIGNSSSAAALMHVITGNPLDRCVGRGTGVDDAGLERKRMVIQAAVDKLGKDGTIQELLARFGGFEIGQLAGAMLGAAEQRCAFVVDGFIATAAAAIAARLQPTCLEYAVFSHRSAETPHAAWLEQLGVRPLLDLGLRLGEGSGAILALPLLRAACAILNNMASFSEAGVSDRE